MNRAATALALICGLASAAHADCVWGFFDTNRINYPGGLLNGSEHTSLVNIINAAGGTLAAPTPTLTPAYLAGIDVFYTSLFRTDGASTLTAAEQAALQGWFNAGGTLVVTADIFGVAAYDSFTSFLGITYTAVGSANNATVVGAHPLTAGVASIAYNTESTFTLPGTGLTLANNFNGQRYSAVMDGLTGFAGPGRLFVAGDHNMFTNTYIGTQDNTRFAQNLANWACIPAPGTGAVALTVLVFAARRRR
jgi:hypothetical protein